MSGPRFHALNPCNITHYGSLELRVSRDRVIGSLSNITVGILGSGPMDVGGWVIDPVTSCGIGFSERKFSLGRDFGRTNLAMAIPTHPMYQHPFKLTS